jgi:hypothetical protein
MNRPLGLLPAIAAIVLATLPGVAPVAAAPLFPNPVYTLGSNPYGLGMVDFNRDGFLDLVSANYGQGYDGGPGDFSVILGRGDGTFSDETRFPSSQHPTNALAGDFDGDGIGDVILTFWPTGQAVLLRGLGDGTFGPEEPFPGGPYASISIYRMSLADFNDDAIPDVVIETGTSVGGFQAFIANGDGTFTPGPVVADGLTTYPVAADFTGDGRDDVAILRYDAYSFAHEVLIYTGNGDGTFLFAGALVLGEDLLATSAADLDGDGFADLGVSIYHLHDSGLNTDMALFFSNADGTFSAGPRWNETYVVGLLAFERNGDGIQDFVRIEDGALTPFLGSGPRTWSALPSLGTGFDVRGYGAGDFNRDGRRDVAVQANFSEAVFTYDTNADGGFGPPPVDPTFTDSSIGGLVTDDFNGDGHLDVASVLLDQASISVRLGHGDGTFGPETRYPAGVGPTFLASADMNRDGARDLVVSLRNWYFEVPIPVPAGDVVVLPGQGDGTFGPPLAPAVSGVFPLAMHVADFDGDGTPDVVVANGTDENQLTEPDVSFFHALGDGTLAPMVRLSVGAGNYYPNGWTSPTGFTSADYDGDGHRDLVVTVSGIPYGAIAPGAVRLLAGLPEGASPPPSPSGRRSTLPRSRRAISTATERSISPSPIRPPTSASSRAGSSPSSTTARAGSPLRRPSRPASVRLTCTWPT